MTDPINLKALSRRLGKCQVRVGIVRGEGREVVCWADVKEGADKCENGHPL